MKDGVNRGIAAFCRDAKPGLILIEDDKVMPALEFAFEIAIRMARREASGRITIWSWQSFMNLHGMWLAGDSMSKIHCWTLGDEVLNGKHDETWLEEILQEHSWSLREESDHAAHSVDWFSLLGECSDVVVLDFRLEFGDMCNLNKAAKELGKKVVAYIDQFAVVIGNRPVSSYVELAMNIGVVHGVDFSECAENVWRLSRRPDTGSTSLSDFIFGKEIHSYDCKLLSSEGGNKFEDGFESDSDNIISFHSEADLMDNP